MNKVKNKLLFRYSRYIKVLFLLSDLFLLNLTFLLSFLMRYAKIEVRYSYENFVVLLIANFCWLAITRNYKAYKIIRTEPIENILYKVLKMSFVFFIILFSMLVLLDYDDISRLQMIYFTLLFFSLVFLFRIWFIHLLKRIRKAGYNYRNVIIIGANANGLAISSILKKDVAYGYRIQGFFCDAPAETKDVNLLGSVSQALQYLKDHPIHEVYMSISHVSSEYSRQLIGYCEDNLIRVKLVPDFTGFTKSRKVQIDFYENLPVISLRPEPLESTFSRFIKRFFDLVFSLLVIICVFPWLFPLLACLIKISSRGPVFFVQERSGEQNNTFRCLKFRTMRVNNLSDELQATKNDNRITGVGKFLRRSNLDELPQFFNVLVGDMSVVGPRPHMLKHTRDYSQLINSFLVRHLVKPGITGWAQVNGFRGETNTLEQMEKRVEYDIWYIENWSFLLDLKIVYLTVKNMFNGNKNAV